MPEIAVKRDPEKWEDAKRDAVSRMGGKHSARAMQLASKIYKDRGGEYAGKKPSAANNSLRTWTKQDWKWSGGDKPGQGGSGVYLPSRAVSALKSTPQGRDKLDRAADVKRDATARGQQFSQHGLHVGKDRSKTAALREDVELRPHQREAIEYLQQQGGRGLLAHGTGTGKTLSSIAAFEKLREQDKAKRALVVAPAALLTNYRESGVGKFTTSTHGAPGSGSDYELVSLEKFRADPHGVLARSGADTLILDEVHRAKDSGSKTYDALRQASRAAGVRNVIGLTGSMVSNHPKEIVPLLDIVNPQHRLGSQGKFSKEHVGVERVSGGFLRPPTTHYNLSNVGALADKARGAVHYVGHDDLGGGGMPRLDMKDVHVEMSPEQQDLYDFAMGKLNPVSRALIKAGLPPSQSEAEHIFGMITKLRQAANSVGTHKVLPAHEAADRTPKLKRAVDDVVEHLAKTPDGQAVLYSNLVHGGAKELHAALKRRGIDAGLYTGPNAELGVDNASRDQDVRDFLARKKRAIVLTPAGSEGISLNNATFFGMVDSHFNPERNAQAIARARRFGGLAHRPQDQRVVQVRRYRSDPRQNFISRAVFGKEVGIDEWIQRVADEKDRLNNELRVIAHKNRESR
jgi:hypothetical protein